MFNKLIGIAVSYLAGRLGQVRTDDSSLYNAFVDRATDRVKSMIQDALLASLTAIFIIVGFFAAFFTSLHQYDLNQTFSFNAVILGSIALMAIGSVGLYYVVSEGYFRKQSEPKEDKKAPTQNEQPSANSALQNALSVLVMDFVKEREFKRQVQSDNQKLYEENVRNAYKRLVEQELKTKQQTDEEKYMN